MTLAGDKKYTLREKESREEEDGLFSVSLFNGISTFMGFLIPKPSL